jgi:hypothetical protein
VMAIFTLRVSREFNQKFLSDFVSIRHPNSSDFVGKHVEYQYPFPRRKSDVAMPEAIRSNWFC